MAQAVTFNQVYVGPQPEDSEDLEFYQDLGFVLKTTKDGFTMNGKVIKESNAFHEVNRAFCVKEGGLNPRHMPAGWEFKDDYLFCTDASKHIPKNIAFSYDEVSQSYRLHKKNVLKIDELTSLKDKIEYAKKMEVVLVSVPGSGNIVDVIPEKQIINYQEKRGLKGTFNIDNLRKINANYLEIARRSGGLMIYTFSGLVQQNGETKLLSVDENEFKDLYGADADAYLGQFVSPRTMSHHVQVDTNNQIR